MFVIYDTNDGYTGIGVTFEEALSDYESHAGYEPSFGDSCVKVISGEEMVVVTKYVVTPKNPKPVTKKPATKPVAKK